MFLLLLPSPPSSRQFRCITPHVVLKKEALKWMVRLCAMGDEAGVKGFDIASLAVPFVIEKIKSLLYHYTNSSDPLVPPPGVLSSLRQAKCSFHIASPSHYSRPSERFDRFSGCNFRTEVVETGEKSTDFVTSGVAQTNQGLDSEHCDDSQAENSAVAELLIVGLEELLSCKIMSKVATRSFPVEVNIANSMRTLRKTSEQQVTSQENPSV